MCGLKPVPVELSAAQRLLSMHEGKTVFVLCSVHTRFVIWPLPRIQSVANGWGEEAYQLVKRAHQGGFWVFMHWGHVSMFRNPRIALKNDKLVLLSDPKITTKLN